MEDGGRNGSRASSEVDGGSSEFVFQGPTAKSMRDLNKRQHMDMDTDPGMTRQSRVGQTTSARRNWEIPTVKKNGKEWKRKEKERKGGRDAGF